MTVKSTATLISSFSQLVERRWLSGSLLRPRYTLGNVFQNWEWLIFVGQASRSEVV